MLFKRSKSVNYLTQQFFIQNEKSFSEVVNSSFENLLKVNSERLIVLAEAYKQYDKVGKELIAKEDVPVKIRTSISQLFTSHVECEKIKVFTINIDDVEDYDCVVAYNDKRYAFDDQKVFEKLDSDFDSVIKEFNEKYSKKFEALTIGELVDFYIKTISVSDDKPSYNVESSDSSEGGKVQFEDVFNQYIKIKVGDIFDPTRDEASDEEDIVKQYNKILEEIELNNDDIEHITDMVVYESAEYVAQFIKNEKIEIVVEDVAISISEEDIEKIKKAFKNEFVELEPVLLTEVGPLDSMLIIERAILIANNDSIIGQLVDEDEDVVITGEPDITDVIVLTDSQKIVEEYINAIVINATIESSKASIKYIEELKAKFETVKTDESITSKFIGDCIVESAFNSLVEMLESNEIQIDFEETVNETTGEKEGEPFIIDEAMYALVNKFVSDIKVAVESEFELPDADSEVWFEAIKKSAMIEHAGLDGVQSSDD